MIATRLTAALRARTPASMAGNDYKPAGVLIPIQERPDDDYLVSTQRGEQLPTHKSQIAVPGGWVHIGGELVQAAENFNPYAD